MDEHDNDTQKGVHTPENSFSTGGSDYSRALRFGSGRNTTSSAAISGREESQYNAENVAIEASDCGDAMSFNLAGQTENSDIHEYSFGGPFDDNEDAGSKPHADLLSGNNMTETGNNMTSDGWTQQPASKSLFSSDDFGFQGDEDCDENMMIHEKEGIDSRGEEMSNGSSDSLYLEGDAGDDDDDSDDYDHDASDSDESGSGDSESSEDSDDEHHDRFSESETDESMASSYLDESVSQESSTNQSGKDGADYTDSSYTDSSYTDSSCTDSSYTDSSSLPDTEYSEKSLSEEELDDDDSSSDDEDVESFEDELVDPEDEREISTYRKEVTALVQKVAPDQIENIDSMMKKFSGRMPELIATLQKMHDRSKSQPSRRGKLFRSTSRKK